MKKIIAVIPARYQSSRFPGKPLAMIAGKPMVQHVYERVKQVGDIGKVFVATDDERIYNCVRSFGGETVLTGECSCGTERVYQAAEKENYDIVINVQGDEPLIHPRMIQELIDTMLDRKAMMATKCKELKTMEEVMNPNIVKVVKDLQGDAVYFSRNPIPYNRDNIEDIRYFKHIGIYSYSREFLEQYVNLPRSPLERAENLEQLRALENGYKIAVAETQYDSVGVDLPEHIQRIEEILKHET